MVIKTVEEYQVMAAYIASKIYRDPEFASKIRQDPLGTLREFNMGNDALRELINEEKGLKQGIKDDSLVQVEEGSCTVTCVCTSGCCFSCWTGCEEAVFGDPEPTVPVNPAREKLLKNLIKSGHITSPEEQ